jgi:hypothetical protein
MVLREIVWIISPLRKRGVRGDLTGLLGKYVKVQQ